MNEIWESRERIRRDFEESIFMLVHQLRYGLSHDLFEIEYLSAKVEIINWLENLNSSK